MPGDLDTLTLLHEKDETFIDFVSVETKPVEARSIPTEKPLEEWTAMFEDMVAKDVLKPHAQIVFEIIQKSLEIDDSSTTQELVGRIRYVRKAMSKAPSAGLCVESAGELFTRLITRFAQEIEGVKDFADVRKMLVARGANCVKMSYEASNSIAKYAMPIFKLFDFGAFKTNRICVDGWDSAIFRSLVEGYKSCPYFTVHVMESAPLRHGIKMGQELKKAGVPCRVFLDSALALAVSQCSAVMCSVDGITPDAHIYVRDSTCSLIHMAERFEATVYITCEFYKITETVEDQSRWKADEQAGCVEIPEEEWTPGMPSQIPTPKNNKPQMRDLPSSHYQTIYTDIGPLGPSSVYENFTLLFT